MADTDPQAQDAAARQRIIKHMNTDHQPSLIRFLQHYAQLPLSTAQSAHLVNISLTSMTLTTTTTTTSTSTSTTTTSTSTSTTFSDTKPQTKTHTIPFHPPLLSLAETRPRVIAMDAEASASLSPTPTPTPTPIPITCYTPPNKLWMQSLFGACALTLTLFSRRAHFLPGHRIHALLTQLHPSLASRAYGIQPYLFYTMAALHAVEAYVMAAGRLRRHAVPVLSPVWVSWVLSTFIEGVGSFVRFDALVAEAGLEKVEKKKASH